MNKQKALAPCHTHTALEHPTPYILTIILPLPIIVLFKHPKQYLAYFFGMKRASTGLFKAVFRPDPPQGLRVLPQFPHSGDYFVKPKDKRIQALPRKKLA